eukprot:SAG22_NODE_10279_length_543_cov_1.558559_1_plen_122_part_01
MLRACPWQIRRFVDQEEILTIPDWLGGTHLAPIPAYLEPLFGLYSDNNMMTEDGISGVGPMSTGLTRFSPPPSPDMVSHERTFHERMLHFPSSEKILFRSSAKGFFPRSCIYDPRPQICHES